MKIKSKIAAISFLCMVVLNSLAQKAFKIRNLQPNQKILIGKKWCGEKDIFYLSQTIHWDKRLANQGFEAYDINHTSTTYVFTKLRANNRDVRGADYIKSLVGKGGQALVLWDNKPIALPIELDSKYQYKIHVFGTTELFDATISENKIILESGMFKTYKGVIKIEVFCIGEHIEAIYNDEIEIIK